MSKLTTIYGRPSTLPLLFLLVTMQEMATLLSADELHDLRRMTVGRCANYLVNPAIHGFAVMYTHTYFRTHTNNQFDKAQKRFYKKLKIKYTHETLYPQASDPHQLRMCISATRFSFLPTQYTLRLYPELLNLFCRYSKHLQRRRGRLHPDDKTDIRKFLLSRSVT